jgi:hypothetical protein
LCLLFGGFLFFDVCWIFLLRGFRDIGALRGLGLRGLSYGLGLTVCFCWNCLSGVLSGFGLRGWFGGFSGGRLFCRLRLSRVRWRFGRRLFVSGFWLRLLFLGLGLFFLLLRLGLFFVLGWFGLLLLLRRFGLFFLLRGLGGFFMVFFLREGRKAGSENQKQGCRAYDSDNFHGYCLRCCEFMRSALVARRDFCLRSAI